MTPFQRHRPLLHRLAMAGLLALPGLSAQAQTGQEALRAADPDTPTRAIATPISLPMPVEAPPLPGDPAEALQQWQRANQRVAAFPRGHIDILRQEAQHAADAAEPSSPGSPLSADEALRQSLRLRPDLLQAASGNALAQSERHQALLAHVVELRRAWVEAVATTQAMRWQHARQEAARSGAELGQRMVQAGNWSQARLLRERLAEATETASLLQARQAALGARERLARLLGVWQSDQVAQLEQRLPAELPAPPASLDGDGSDIEARVLARDTALALQRIDAAREIDATTTAQRAAWDGATRESAAGLGGDNLPTAPLSLTDARLGKDHALESAVAAEAGLLRAAVERRSAAREAWGRLQAQHALAHQAQAVILPLQTALEQETLLRYNGMLQSTWELLEASRERMAATATAALARRDFWLAHLDWQLLLAGGAYQPPGASAAMAPTGSAAQGH